MDRWSVAHCIDHFRNDVTQSALFACLFLLATEYALYVVWSRKGAGVMPVSCCTINCTNCFKQDAGIGFYTIPAKQEQREVWLRAISRAGWEVKSSDRHCGKYFVSGRQAF